MFIRTPGLSILSATALLLIAGCVRVTPHQNADTQRQHGVTSIKLSDNRYRVTVRTNPHTDPTLTQADFWKRVAELCGCQYPFPTESANRECAREISYRQYEGAPASTELVRESNPVDLSRRGRVTITRQETVPAVDSYAEGEVECLKKNK
jgi:hypothetical protein